VEHSALEHGARPELMNWQVLEEESRRAYFARGAPSRSRAAAAVDAQARGAPPTEPAAQDAATATAETDAIDGQAFLVDEPRNAQVPLTAHTTAAPPDPTADHATETAANNAADNVAIDQVDSILIASLPERQLVVRPGGTTTLVVSLLNNGSLPALFDVHVEGWIHESWLPEPPHPLLLKPGERAAATITLAPPRNAITTAGEFPIFVVVRSTQYLRRSTRLGATLHILPFTEFGVGRLMPATAPLGAFRRSAVFALPATNLSNHPITLSLQGQAAGLPCHFEFRRAVALRPVSPQLARSDGGWEPDPVLLDLQPDEIADLLVRVTVTSAPLFGTRPVAVPFRVVAGVEGEARPPRTAAGDVAYMPPVRAWHLLAAGLASVMLLALMGLLAVGARLLLESSRVAPQQAVSAPVAPVVIVLNQSVPLSPGAASTPAAALPSTTLLAPAPAAQGASTANTAGASAAASNSLPQVQPNMVTRPGEAAPVANASALESALATSTAPAAVARGGPRAAAAAPYTYAEMFQQIALTYDLDWRLLAAQAYVESGFDTLALGQDGDMGLMQVLPSTWREWAPTVGANDPFDANANTLVAAAYLDHVRALMGQRGLPQAQWMLVAYNWGPDRLGQFLDEGGTWEQLPAVRAQYAADILRIARTIP
jgi:soluble lytic murein transglycosylase-like protein